MRCKTSQNNKQGFLPNYYLDNDTQARHSNSKGVRCTILQWQIQVLCHDKNVLHSV